MKPNKLAIHGGSYTGKDTVAEYLIDKDRYVKVAFADPIYWIARNVFFMKEKNRALLQFIGQGGRLIYPDIWVKIALRKINRLISKGHKVIVTDLRQENEYLYLIRYGFEVIHVSSTLENRKFRCWKRDGIEPQLNLWERKAEIGADKYIGAMWKLPNNGSLKELHQKIDRLINSMG